MRVERRTHSRSAWQALAGAERGGLRWGPVEGEGSLNGPSALPPACLYGITLSVSRQGADHRCRVELLPLFVLAAAASPQ